MRTFRNPVVALILAALIGSAALYAVVFITSSPSLVNIAEIDASYEGRYVTTAGILKDAGAPSYTHLLLADNGSEISVLLDSQVGGALNLTPGDILSVTGEVESYGGEIFIRVLSPAGVSVLKEAASELTPISLILQDPARFEGTYIRTSGAVGEVQEYRDETRLLLRCRTGDVWLHSDSGDIERPENYIASEMVVRGHVEFNGLRDRYEILVNGSDMSGQNDGVEVSASDVLSGNISEGTAVILRGFPDMEVYESAAYATLRNGTYSLSLVAYDDSVEDLKGMEGSDAVVTGMLRYSSYSGRWRLVISGESKSF